jgi:hypothetical protein
MKDEVRKRLLTTLAGKGFSSARSALASFPTTAPMVEVGKSLGVTAVQFVELLRLEVELSELKSVATRILLGELTRFLGDTGWPSDKSTKSVFPTVRAHVAWTDIIGDDLKDQIKRVFDRLRALAPTPGWRPLTVDDPLLVQAFEAW